MEHAQPISWILSRRSIRNYSNRTISDAEIHKILTAAMYALSARNCQPWHFRELFNLPEYIQPFALVSLGYSDVQKALPERFKPERIHYNSWGHQ